MEITTRNANLADLAAMLQEQHTRKLDVVVPATGIRAVGGNLRIDGTDFVPDATGGIKEIASTFRPTVVCDEGLAEKLGVPVQYLKKIRSNRPDLFDANVNGWLHGRSKRLANGETESVYDADARNFLVRTFKGEGTENGIARAFLSDGYKIIDNLDVLTAALEGVKDAQTNVQIDGCDLTERRMYIRIVAPEISALAPTLLEGYRSPFSQGVARAGSAEQGQSTDLPVIHAGFILSNSETGGGAFTITPRLVIQICKNGMTINKDATRAVHLGSKMDEGIIKWSEDTQRKNLELITAKARDAVATFLDTEYMERVIRQLEEKAGKRIEHADKVVKAIGTQLRFSEERTQGILDHFILGGQMTAAGVLNAVTSFAQTIDNADEAFEIEGRAIQAFELAASA